MYQPWWIQDAVCALASVNRPADTILLAEKHDPDNRLWFGPRASFYWDSVWDTSWGCGSIPSSLRDPAAAYPNGPDGCVANKHSGMSNFAFADGHAKAMRPSATNVNMWDTSPAVWDKNMWDATRP